LTVTPYPLKLVEDFYLRSSRKPMICRAFADKIGGRWFIRLALAAAMAVVLVPFAARSQGVGRQSLHGHVPPAVAQFQLHPTGRLPATNLLNMSIGLPLRNQAALDKLLAEIYDPASTNYHRYLTPEQFAAQFGPTEQDYQSLIVFAKTNGLTVTAMYPNRALLDVSGKVADIERVFHVKLNLYQHPTENRSFFAPDAEPSVDFTVPILHISGLDNFFIPRPAVLKKNPLNKRPAGVPPAYGSAPDGSSYIGNDFRAAYVPGTALNGAGQVVGLFELDGYYANDITAYENLAGLPNVTLTNILVDGFSGSAGGNNIEVALDIEMAISMATNQSKVIVYEGPNPGNPADILTRIANDNLAKQISSSWIIQDDPSFDTAYKQMAVQGQSFFQASGDYGAYYSGVAQWADDTNITLVGGTTLSTTGPGGAWSSETVWNQYSTREGTGGSGGGTNYNNIPIPGWQTGINMTANQGSTTLRNVPDVALTADNIWVIHDNGQSDTVGGTSCAAPLWAGFTALINQQAALVGSPTVGFLNPAIYAIGKGTNYALDFHDITTGNNTNKNVRNKYFAVPGYDLCAGWGTPDGVNLITALAIPDTLGILPGTGFNAAGPVGGPFNVTSQIFSLTNSGVVSLNWSVQNIPAWLNVAPNSGTLTAGNPATSVTVNVNSSANSLPAGIYSTNLTFTNLTTGFVQFRQFTLQVLPLILNGDFETGDFSHWTLAGNGIIGATIYNAVVSAGSLTDNAGTNFIHSGTYGAFLGDSQIATLSQTLNTFPGQGYLLSFWLANPVSGSGQQFLVNWNTNGTSTNQIYFLNNPPVLSWTNLTFVVIATGTNTTLQFGAANPPDGFGLDDVSVTPIFQLTAVTKTNDNFKLLWNGVTNRVYQVQYKTNLLQAAWLTNITFTATNSDITFVDTNPIAGSPQKFYRLLLLQ
jgi:hypothetical protein